MLNPNFSTGTKTMIQAKRFWVVDHAYTCSRQDHKKMRTGHV